MNKKLLLILTNVFLLGTSIANATESLSPKKRPLPTPPQKSQKITKTEEVKVSDDGRSGGEEDSQPQPSSNSSSSATKQGSSSSSSKDSVKLPSETELPSNPENIQESDTLWTTHNPKKNSREDKDQFLARPRPSAEGEEETKVNPKQLQQDANEDLKTAVEASQCYYSTIEPEFTNAKVREALISLGEYLPPIREKIKSLYADNRSIKDKKEIENIINEIYQSIQGVIATSKRSSRALMMSIPQYIKEATKSDKTYPTARNNADLQMIVSLSPKAKTRLKQCLTNLTPFKGTADKKTMDTLQAEINQTLEIADNLKEHTGEAIAKKMIESSSVQ